MSVYLGNNLLAGTPDITGKANTSLNNLDSTGQAVIDGKADIDVSNLSTAGKSLISGLGLPSNRYIDLTRGASGSNYTAPANGWFTACVTGSSSHYCFIRSHDSRIGSSYQFNAASGSWHCVTIPCKSGDVVTMQYGNCDFQRFAFVYAEGEENV